MNNLCIKTKMASSSSVILSMLPAMLAGLDKKKETFIQEIEKVVAKVKENVQAGIEARKIIENIDNLGLFFDQIVPGSTIGDVTLKESSSPSTYGRLEPHLVERIQSLETEVVAIQRSQNNDQNRMNAIQADVTSVRSDVAEMKSKMADFEETNGIEIQTFKEDIASLKSAQFRELESIEKLASDSEKCLNRTGKLESEIENFQKTTTDQAGKQKAATDRESAELKSIRHHVKDTKDKFNALEMELDDSWNVLPVLRKVERDVKLGIRIKGDGPDELQDDTSQNYDTDGKYFTVPVSGFYMSTMICNYGNYANWALYKDDEGSVEPVRYSTTLLHKYLEGPNQIYTVSLIRLNAGDKVKYYRPWYGNVDFSWFFRLIG